MKVKRLPAEVNALARRLEAMDDNLKALAAAVGGNMDDNNVAASYNGTVDGDYNYGGYNWTDWGEVLKLDEEVL